MNYELTTGCTYSKSVEKSGYCPICQISTKNLINHVAGFACESKYQDSGFSAEVTIFCNLNFFAKNISTSNHYIFISLLTEYQGQCYGCGKNYGALRHHFMRCKLPPPDKLFNLKQTFVKKMGILALKTPKVSGKGRVMCPTCCRLINSLKSHKCCKYHIISPLFTALQL